MKKTAPTTLSSLSEYASRFSSNDRVILLTIALRREIELLQQIESLRAEIEQLRAALEQQSATTIEPQRVNNQDGMTQCMVRWMVETPAGWLGAWDREAFDAYVAAARQEASA